MQAKWGSIEAERWRMSRVRSIAAGDHTPSAPRFRERAECMVAIGADDRLKLWGSCPGKYRIE